ncbi:ATP-binding protein [Paracoccaceae bacterium]|nr:ATP-binding protein [Paracoccaceae bacterium]
MENRRVFIECENGHTYQTTIKRAEGNQCPICRSQQLFEREQIEVNGIGFSSLEEIAEKYSIPERTLRYRMRRGHSIEEILKNLNKKQITVKGRTFPSLRQAAKEYALPMSFINKRLRAGMAVEEAFQIENFKSIKDEKNKRWKSWKDFTDYEERIKSWDDTFNSVKEYAESIANSPEKKEWTQHEETIFNEMVNEGRPIDFIALKLECSDEDITKKLQERGVLEEYALNNYEYFQMKADEQAAKLGKSNNLKVKADVLTSADVRRFIASKENKVVEFKQTFSFDVNQQKSKSQEVMHSSIKTIAGFANATGGRLLIGVDDDFNITGLDQDDYSGNHDEYVRKIGDKVNDCLTKLGGLLLDIKIVEMENEKEVCVVKVEQSKNPIYCKNKKISQNEETFYLRQMGKTVSLPPSEMVAYIKKHFND